MPEIPRINGREAIAAFKKDGWDVCRTNGSHFVMKKAGNRFRLSIPKHASKTIGVGLLDKQIKIAGLTIEQFKELL